jgi:hypothetical protein
MGDIVSREIDLRGMRRARPVDAGAFDEITDIAQFKRGRSRSARLLLAIGAATAALVLLWPREHAPRSGEGRIEITPATAPRSAPAPVEAPPPATAPDPPREPDEAPAAVTDSEPRLAAASPETATLEIDSDPPVSVFEADRRLGKTPLKVSLPVGKHELRFSERRLHLEEHQKLNLSAEGRKLALSFATGGLELSAPDATRLWIDKDYVGEAPFQKIELAEGKHRIRVKHGTEELAEVLEVPPSGTVQYQVRFPN